MNSISSKRITEENGSTFKQSMWWTKVYTTNPFCIYYFGPFDQMVDAQSSRFGYIEDLESEGAKVVFVKLTQLIPQSLTVEFRNLSHVRWLHELMQDTLMLRLPYMSKELI
jgi:hypothetical protein